MDFIVYVTGWENKQKNCDFFTGLITEYDFIAIFGSSHVCIYTDQFMRFLMIFA